MSRPIAASVIYKTNCNAVFEYLRNHESATIPQLSERFSLSLPTVTRIINAGLESGFFRVSGIVGEQRGRKAKQYSICKDYTHFLLVCIEAGSLSFRVCDFTGRTVRSASYEIDDSSVIGTLDSVILDCKKNDDLISACYVSALGVMVDYSEVDCKILRSCIFSSFEQDNIAEHYAEITDIPVYFYNDMTAVIEGTKLYAGKVFEGCTVAFAYDDNCYGASVVVDGEIIGESSELSNNLGYFSLDKTGKSRIEVYSGFLYVVIAMLKPQQVYIYDCGSKAEGAEFIRIFRSGLPDYLMPEFVSSRDFISDCYKGLYNIIRKGFFA